MRTANPFDGRAFVRSRNDVNPSGRNRRGIFANCQSLIGGKADCPRPSGVSLPRPVVFTFPRGKIRWLRFSLRTKGEGMEGRERVGEGDQYFFKVSKGVENKMK